MEDKDKTYSIDEIIEENYGKIGTPTRAAYEYELKKELILEYNKMFARYLGYEYYPYSKESKIPAGWWNKDFIALAKVVSYKIHWNYFLCRTHKELRFFNDWNLLMEVYTRLIHDFQHDDESMKLLEQADDSVVCANRERFFYSLVEVVKYLNESKG